MYLQGLHHFTLLTAYRPFIPILNSMGIADVENPRLQRPMMKMLPYSFTAQWVKGKVHLAVDALLRFPVDQPHLMMNCVELMLKQLCAPTLLISRLKTCNYTKFLTPNTPTLSSLDSQTMSAVDCPFH